VLSRLPGPQSPQRGLGCPSPRGAAGEGIARMPRRARRGRTGLLLRGLLLLRGHGAGASAAGQCDALTGLMARLNPGFWAPAFVFRSLDVKPAQMHPPKRKKQGGTLRLPGICTHSNFRADLFTWQKPTSDGGDWISTTSGTNMMQVVTDSYSCPLTGIAVTTTGWPSLRLQFEECPRKTAVEVPLVNSTAAEGSTKLVSWMCQVASGSRLCREARERLPDASSRSHVWGNQLYLDLQLMAKTLSGGLTRMEVSNECFESLDWLIADSPLAVDPAELQMLAAMASLLAPSSWPRDTRIPADIIVESTCMEDCNGDMPAKCKPAPPPPVHLDTKELVQRSPDRSMAGSFRAFTERYDDPVILPWLAYFCAGLFLLGSALACCCPSCWPPLEQKQERRIKKVSVVYHEVPEESAFFSH